LHPDRQPTRNRQISRTEKIVNIAAMLEEGGCDVDAVDSDGITPLHLAAQEGNGPLVEFLLQCAANVKIADSRGETALHLAAVGNTRGHLMSVKLLAEYGASLLAMNDSELTAEECALLGMEGVDVPSKIQVSIAELLRQLTECVIENGGSLELRAAGDSLHVRNKKSPNRLVGEGGGNHHETCLRSQAAGAVATKTAAATADSSMRSTTRSPFDSVFLSTSSRKITSTTSGGSSVRGSDSDAPTPVNPFRLQRTCSSGSASPITGLYHVPAIGQSQDGELQSDPRSEPDVAAAVTVTATGGESSGWWSALRTTAHGMLARRNKDGQKSKNDGDGVWPDATAEVTLATDTAASAPTRRSGSDLRANKKNSFDGGFGAAKSGDQNITTSNCSTSSDDEGSISDTWRSVDELPSDCDLPTGMLSP
jgi:hypothetical protein